jgi:hypothetical protein
VKLPRRRFLHLAASVAALPAMPRLARAQAYPSRPVRIIAPTGPLAARPTLSHGSSDRGLRTGSASNSL